MDLECFSCFYQVSAFSSLVGSLRYVLTRDRVTNFCVFQLVLLLFILLSSLSSHD